MIAVRSQQGFSLLELVVVLAIVGVASALVVPRLTGTMSNTRLRTTVKEIAATLRYARSTAASQKITRTVHFDLDRSRVTLGGGTAPEEAAGEGEAPGETTGGGAERAASFDLPEEVRVEKAIWGEEFVDSGAFEIHFFPNGGSSGGELILVNDRERRCGIRVDLITGMVRLTQDPDAFEERDMRRPRSGFAVIRPGGGGGRGLTVIR